MVIRPWAPEECLRRLRDPLWSRMCPHPHHFDQSSSVVGVWSATSPPLRSAPSGASLVRLGRNPGGWCLSQQPSPSSCAATDLLNWVTKPVALRLRCQELSTSLRNGEVCWIPTGLPKGNPLPVRKPKPARGSYPSDTQSLALTPGITRLTSGPTRPKPSVLRPRPWFNLLKNNLTFSLNKASILT